MFFILWRIKHSIIYCSGSYCARVRKLDKRMLITVIKFMPPRPTSLCSLRHKQQTTSSTAAWAFSPSRFLFSPLIAPFTISSLLRARTPNFGRLRGLYSPSTLPTHFKSTKCKSFQRKFQHSSPAIGEAR